MLADSLRIARRNKRLSYAKLSELTGISKAYLWGLENGRETNPTILMVKLLAQHLDVTMTQLLDKDFIQDDSFRLMLKFDNLTDKDKQRVMRIIDSWVKE
jgi:transcriptional regulator with XRE-family HTH domain